MAHGDAVTDSVAHIVGRPLSADERSLVSRAVADGATTQEGLIEYIRVHDSAFAYAIATGRYLDAMLKATKEVAKGKIDAIVAKKGSSQFFLIGKTRHQLAVFNLDELTPEEQPAQEEVVRVLRNLLKREGATGCVIVADTMILPEGEFEETTGKPRRIGVLFALALARGGSRSILLPLDGGPPVWHDFTAVATGLEHYTALCADLAEFP